MINVVCLKWGDKYGAEYVNRLYHGVQRNITHDIRFWCFTENASGIRSDVEILPLNHGKSLHTWWHKIWLFSSHNGLPLGEQILYIDLDTLIVGYMDDLMAVDQVPDLVVLRDFYQGIARTAGEVGSGIMSWRHGVYDHIWQQFAEDTEAAVQSVHPHGDQAWIAANIEAWYYWQDLFPGRVVSYKIHCADGLPKDASIVCYHGRPSIPESVTESMPHSTALRRWQTKPAPWVLDHWRDDS